MSMTGRILAALFAALIFTLLYPLGLWAAHGGVSFNSIGELLGQLATGAALGAGLGALFPKVFEFFFQAMIEVSRRSSGT